MKVSQIILDKILNDNEFSLELAKIIGIQQQSVKALAKRNSKILTLYQAIIFYKERGFEDKDIFFRED